MALKLLNKNKKTQVGAVQEPAAFIEIGGYVHQDEGQVQTKLYVSDVNQPLKIDDAAITKRMKKIRVTMTTEEDKTPYTNQVYGKKVGMDQEILDDLSTPKGTTSTSSEYPNTGASSDNDSQSPLSKGETFLKNMVDNLWSDLREAKTQGLIGLVLLGLTAIVAVAAFVKAFF